ncbi:AntA/AntB antirepressor [Psychrobacter phage vB_PmaS_Y8A]|nr:AntA/AntB antirepressor [Psychrobacter phage vB_PmaS_Y8A]
MNFPIIQQHQDLQQAVSARELYDFLQPTERFASWFERQLQYGFVASQDYLGCEVFNTLARQSLQDYFISIDMAKEISMIQRSDKGKQARQYFIECERKIKKQPVTPAIPQSFAEALQLAADQAKQLELAAPKVSAYDKLIESTHLKSVGDVAKSIGLKSAQALNKKLEAVRAYDGRCGNRVWSGWFVEQGLGEMRTTDEGYSSNKMTAKGQAWALNLFGGNE